MKNVITFLSIILIAFCVFCSKSKDVTISLTNPQNIAVAYDGYYSENQGAQVAMTGTTPHDYEFTMSSGDRLDGIVYKSDSTNMIDTLHFRILVDTEEQTSLTRDIVIPTQLGGISFQLTVQ